jgi:hypothetical protein
MKSLAIALAVSVATAGPVLAASSVASFGILWVNTSLEPTRPDEEARLAAIERQLDDNPQAMRQRRETVEHPFGTIKARMGAMHFLMKTLPRVSGEMALHRAEQLASVTNRIHADVAQVLGAQIRQDFGVNVVVAKRLLVALQPQFTQPRANVHRALADALETALRTPPQ